MIVWIASYPRSGNTFMRILLHRLYGATSSTIYDVDGVALRLGADLVGYEKHSMPYRSMRESDTVHFVKTHRRCDELVSNEDRAICLVRDGRDAVVSWARQRAEHPERNFGAELSDLVVHPERVGAGCWGSNVLSWLEAPLTAHKIVHFNELVATPIPVAAELVDSLDIGLVRIPGSSVPSFRELQAIDSAFFRQGKVGGHRKEMHLDLQVRFLAVRDNREALQRLGYAAL